MGMTYTKHNMVGTYIYGQDEDLYLFLEQHGYPITDEQKEEIDENGQFNYDIVEMCKLKGMDIVNLNSWSGHDFVIGYHVKDKSDMEEYAKKFAKYFPNVPAEYHDFVEVS